MLRRFASFLLLAGTLVASAPAHALDIYGILLKVGLRGGPNIPVMNEPTFDNRLYPYVPYTRYWGLGWNGGVAAHFRVLNILALEVGWMYSTETASGNIELRNVSDCRGRTAACPNLQVEQTFQQTAHHIPIVLQAHLPLGNASLFASGGIDIVTNRSNRSLRLRSEDPFPQDLNPNNPEEAELLAKWENDGFAQNLLRAQLNDTPNTIIGLTGGVGINIQTRTIELPVEFRFNIYPASGALLNQRGDFGTPCPDPALCAYDPSSPPPRYNDIWTAQFFILFGLDYILF